MGSAPRSGRRLDTRTEPPEKGPRAAQGQPLPQAKGEGLAHRGGRLGPRRVRIGHSREQGLGKWPGDRGSGQRSRGGQLLGAPRPGLRCSPGTGQLRPGSDLQSAATPCLPSACPLGGAGDTADPGKPALSPPDRPAGGEGHAHPGVPRPHRRGHARARTHRPHAAGPVPVPPRSSPRPSACVPASQPRILSWPPKSPGCHPVPKVPLQADLPASETYWPPSSSIPYPDTLTHDSSSLLEMTWARGLPSRPRPEGG